MPMPPASETAATSSALLHGYIAPQMSGTAMPASRINAVSRMRGRRGTHEPADATARHHVAGGVGHDGLEPHLLLRQRRGRGAAALRDEEAARLLQEIHLEVQHDRAQL